MAVGKNGRRSMDKCILIFLLAYLILIPLSLAKDKTVDLATLQNEYGYDLTKAPFFLRFTYQKQFKRDWKKTDFSQRESFLIDYEVNLAQQHKLENEEIKQEAQNEKELSDEKKAELSKNRQRLKEEAAEEKAEEDGDAQRDKEVNQGLEGQQRELQQMLHDTNQ